MLPDDPKTIEIGHLLALNAEVRGEHGTAVSIVEAVLVDSRRTHGPDATETRDLEQQLARELAAVGRTDEAVGVYERLQAASVVRGDQRQADYFGECLDRLRG